MFPPKSFLVHCCPVTVPFVASMICANDGKQTTKEFEKLLNSNTQNCTIISHKKWRGM